MHCSLRAERLAETKEHRSRHSAQAHPKAGAAAVARCWAQVARAGMQALSCTPLRLWPAGRGVRQVLQGGQMGALAASEQSEQARARGHRPASNWGPCRAASLQRHAGTPPVAGRRCTSSMGAADGAAARLEQHQMSVGDGGAQHAARRPHDATLAPQRLEHHRLRSADESRTRSAADR